VALIIIGIGLYICWYFTKTPMGNVALSIKSNEERAKFVGFNVQATKLIFLTLLGFLAGISGALYAQFQEFIATSVIDGMMSTNVLFMAYIGGTGFFWGPIIGSGIFVYLSEYLSSFTDRWELILGLIFIAVVLFAPQGIMGVVRKKK
jgi:branched-chain amino acid transport system permease protein